MDQLSANFTAGVAAIGAGAVALVTWALRLKMRQADEMEESILQLKLNNVSHEDLKAVEDRLRVLISSGHNDIVRQIQDATGRIDRLYRTPRGE